MHAAFRRFFIRSCSAVLLSTAFAGCAIVREQERVGAYIDDSTVTARVKAKFARENALSVMAIGVATRKGVVQLSGFAKSPEEKDVAERLARNTPGVTEVRNAIAVRS